MRHGTNYRKLLSSENGVSLIEILVSLAILSMVVLYVYQGFYAANENARFASKVDFGKMIAETTQSKILSNPNLFVENMLWLKANSASEIPLEKKDLYAYDGKNTKLKMSAPVEGSVNENGKLFKTLTYQGTASLEFTKKGLLSKTTLRDEDRLKCDLTFKMVKKDQSIQLCPGQTSQNLSPKIVLPSASNTYSLILMDNEEEKLRGLAGMSSGNRPVAKAYLYKTRNFESIKVSAATFLSVLENDFAVWVRLYCWLELIHNGNLSQFINNVIALPTKLSDQADVMSEVSILKQDEVGYVDIYKSQVDDSFGAIPIVLHVNKADNSSPYTIEVANLSSYHLDLFENKAQKSTVINGRILEGSVGFIDLSQTEFNESSIELGLTITDVESGQVLFKTKDYNPRFKIEL